MTTPIPLTNRCGPLQPYVWYETEGFPQTSVDGTVVVFPCKRVNVGTLIGDSNAVIKTIAILRADGSIDTATTTVSYRGALLLRRARRPTRDHRLLSAASCRLQVYPYGGTATVNSAFHHVT